MSNWYSQSAPDDDIVISTRVRIARNLSGIPFPSRMTKDDRNILNNKVKDAILNSNTPFSKSLKYISMSDVPKIEVYSMVERHIISPEFAELNGNAAIILSDDESISIMIGEEDHLRIQVLLPGLQLEKAYNTADQLESLLDSSLHFAFDRQLGYITECPTNLGTGLRASVMLHLPVTEGSGKISVLSESINKIGFTVRGMYGEGTKALASLYQVSNQITLGISEKNAIDNLKIIATQLCQKERDDRNTLNKIKTEDMCWRAYGILKNSRLLTSEEMMNLLSRIKLGIGMGIININESPVKLLIEGQPNMIMRKKGNMEAAERDMYRATMFRQVLQEM